MLPKYSLDIEACEVARIFKLNASGSVGSVSTIRANVERRLKKFHEDLFPETASNKPVLNASEYLSGKNSLPYLLTPDPEKKLFSRAENVDIQLEDGQYQVFSIDMTKTLVFEKLFDREKEEKVL